MSSECSAPNVTELIRQFREGKRNAANHLMELFYPELRRLAAAKMRGERADHSWQPTVLVNEFYLELIKTRALSGAESGTADKQAFLGLAAFVMKRLLIHHARPLASRAVKVTLEETPGAVNAGDLQLIDDLLLKLGEIDPQLRTVVEMKVFEGMSVDEIALRLSCAPRTIARRWAFARQWLRAQLEGEQCCE